MTLKPSYDLRWKKEEHKKEGNTDKNVDICLINIPNILRADEEMVEELGGQTCKFKTAEEVKKEILADSSTNIMEIEWKNINKQNCLSLTLSGPGFWRPTIA